MRKVNLIVVYNYQEDKILMCKRRKDPYKGLFNFVGGKVEDKESGLKAAYRELVEETSITKEDIRLTHFMDFTYYVMGYSMEVYVGRLEKETAVKGDENDLYWIDANENFFDTSKFAGWGNIGHLLHMIHLNRDKLFF